MSNVVKGMVSGFVATVVLSALMMLKASMGIMPGLDIAAMLAKMMGSSLTVGWIAHFMIGTVAWGVGFALLNGFVPGKSLVIKGCVFGFLAWLLMMIAIMPMAGAGLFGLNLGIIAPMMTLILHIIFGAVLGKVYAVLTNEQPDAR